MSINKNQLARFRVIDKCLSNPKQKFWSKQELITHILESTDINISERTLDNDIYFLRHNEQLNYNAPIAYSKSKNGYFYTKEDFSIENLPLNEREIEALEFAAATLRQYRNIGIFNDFTGTVDKLITLVNSVDFKKHKELPVFIDFEKVSYSRGLEHLDISVQAIKSKTALEIQYQKFVDDQVKTHVFSPYLLKEYRNRWYLIGLLNSKNAIVTLGLDRILIVKFLSSDIYKESPSFDFESYFKNTLGITYRPEDPVDIILSFSKLEGQYIKTQHIHHSQELLFEDEKEVRVKLKLVPNYELLALILSLGHQVKVIEPLTLRKEVGKELSEMLKNYLA